MPSITAERVERLHDEEAELSTRLTAIRRELLSLGAEPRLPIEATGRTSIDVDPDILFAALEKTRMPMVVTDPRLDDNPIIFVNRAFVDLSGYGKDEIVGRNCRFLQGPDTDPVDVRKVGQAIRHRRDISTVILNHRKDGSTFQNELYISPVYAPDGTLLYFFGSQVDVTKFDATQRLLGESEARYRSILDSTLSLAIIVTDGEGCITHWNRGAALILGWSLQEVLGQRVDFIFSLDDRRAGRPIENIRRAGEAGRADNARWYLRKDGSSFFAAGETVPIRQSDGAIRGFLIVLRDTTEQHLTSEALKETATRLSMAMSASELGEWDLDLDTDRSIRSPRHDEIFGYPSPLAEWGFRHFIDHVVPNDREHVSRLMAEALETGRAWHVEARITRADGAQRWIEVHGEPVLRENGRATRMIGMISDITVRKDAERSLVDQNEHLEAQVESTTRDRDRIWRNSQDLLIVVSKEGLIEDVNPAFGRLLGWTSEDLVGTLHHALSHLEDQGTADAKLDEILRDRVMVPFTARLRHRDGSHRWIAWTASADDGKVYAHGRDVTAEREQAEALAGAEEALRQSQKMEAIGQLTGGIAHDFNNLLTGIVGSLDLLQRRVMQGRLKDVERYVQGAISSANRAAALTHRLLAFARRQPLEPRTVDVNDLAASLEDLVRRTIGEDVRLELVRAADLWPVICDPNQLESAILNLAINARDAMPDGGRLTIETCNARLDHAYVRQHPSVQAGEYVCVAVSDTGTGMSPDVAARAFDPFFTTKPLGQGTGLGLSMIYGFAKQSEGHAKIYSEHGRGTTIKIYLPRHHGDVADDVVRKGSIDDHRGGGETVLVVEDDPVVRGLVVEVLGDLGYRAIEASDGAAGLLILEGARDIDLLVTDVGLPGINGRQLADRARAARPGLKVLFITGYAENAMFGAGYLTAGMEMVTKPFSIETLAERIKQMIGRT